MSTARERELDAAVHRQRYRARPEVSKWLDLKNRSRKKRMPLLISKEEFGDWYLRQEKKCFYCDLEDLRLDRAVRGKTPIFFTIDRKSSEGPYALSNIVICCWRCNSAKGDWFTFEEWRDIAQVWIKRKWQKMETALAA